MKNTLIVNLVGGPSSGKSTLRAGIFSDLKFLGIDCEEVTEYAKDLTWAKRKFDILNQIHVFGEQHHRIWKLNRQVDVVITDSSLLLTPIYDVNKGETLKKLTLEEFHMMRNYVVYVKRNKPYNPNGRSQTETEAKEIDLNIFNFLMDNHISFETADGTPDGKAHVVRKILLMLGKVQKVTRKQIVNAIEP